MNGQPVRQHDRDLVLGIAVALLCMVGMFLWVHHQQGTINRQQGTINRQQHQLGFTRLYEIEACQRLQIIRVEDNISHLADWRVFTSVLAARGPTSQHFYKVLQTAADEKTWVPIVDCERAVNRLGARYRPARPIPFHEMLPPRQDLELPASYFK